MTLVILFYYLNLISRNASSTAQCLLNSPVSAFSAISSTYQYPGQFYTLQQQCQLAIGVNSTSAGCNVTLN